MTLRFVVQPAVAIHTDDRTHWVVILSHTACDGWVIEQQGHDYQHTILHLACGFAAFPCQTTALLEATRLAAKFGGTAHLQKEHPHEQPAPR